MEMNEAALIQSAAVAIPLVATGDTAAGDAKTLAVPHPRQSCDGHVEHETSSDKHDRPKPDAQCPSSLRMRTNSSWCFRSRRFRKAQ